MSVPGKRFPEISRETFPGNTQGNVPREYPGESLEFHLFWSEHLSLVSSMVLTCVRLRPDSGDGMVGWSALYTISISSVQP